MHCKKKLETTAPQITFSFSNNVINDSIKLATPEELSFSYFVSDNEELHSTRLFLYKTSNNVDHPCSIQDDYSYLELVKGLQGKDFEYTRIVGLPDSIDGSYVIEFEALDQAGNISTSEIDLIITNEKLPRVDSLITIPANSSCALSISSDLEELSLRLKAHSEELIDEVTIYWFENDQLLQMETNAISASNEIDEEFVFAVPNSSTSTMLLKLKTTAGGISRWSELEVTVSE